MMRWFGCHRLRVVCAVCVSLQVLGCVASSRLSAPRLTVRAGPAHEQLLRRIVALPATCGMLTALQNEHGHLRDNKVTNALACTRRLIASVDALVRSYLEFDGLDVIDSETVNAMAFTRLERLFTENGVTEVASNVRGARFADASPRAQDEILAELQVDGLVDTTIWVGAGVGLSARRGVEVQVRVLHVPTGDFMWMRRCWLEAGFESNRVLALEAARCAVSPIDESKRSAMGGAWPSGITQTRGAR